MRFPPPFASFSEKLSLRFSAVHSAFIPLIVLSAADKFCAFASAGIKSVADATYSMMVEVFMIIQVVCE